MRKYFDKVTYYGDIINDKLNGEGVVINEKGEILGAGIFVNDWMK